MVYTKLEKTDFEVLAFLINNLNSEYSIREIAKYLKKPYVKAHKSIKRLSNQKIVSITIKGKSHYCKVDVNNNLDVICFIEYQKSKEFLLRHKKIKLALDEIANSVKSANYSLIIFGSYAKGTSDKNSDLDIAAITSKEDKEEAEKAIKSAKMISSLNIHSLEFTYQEFIEMLKSKQNNAGKEIAKNRIILKGAEQFHECIRLSK